MLFLKWYNDTSRKIIENNKYVSDINLIVYSVIGKMQNDLLNNGYELSDSEINLLNLKVNEYISSSLPIAYIVGFEIFLDNYIKVTQDTLIPRFETEELVLLMASKIKKNFEKGSHISLVDVCTGTGVIGISLYKLLKDDFEITLTLSDISTKALEVAKENLEYHNINANVLESDLLKVAIENEMKFDILLSNPPYIDKSEIIGQSVYDNEPHIALFADDNGLFFYKRIIDDFEKVLNKNAIVGFEIGYKQAKELNEYLMGNYNLKFDVYKDINGKDRMLILENYVS